MVARFFKNNDRLGLMLLPVVALACWSFSLLFPAFHVVKLSNSFLLGYLEPYLSTNVWRGLNLLTAIGGAYLVSLLCMRQEITEKQNQLPAFIYLVFCGLLNQDSACHPLLLASVPLAGAFYLLFGTYRAELSLSEVFDAAFLLSLGALIYSPLLSFLLVPFVSLLVLKPFKLREWLLILLGMALPVIFTATVLFLCNRDPHLLISYAKNAFVPLHALSFGKGTFLIHAAVILLSLLGIYSSLFRSGNFKIKTQKVKSVLVWILVSGIAGSLFISQEPFFKAALLIIPLSIFIGDYLGTIKKGLLREFLTLLLLAASICSQLQAGGYL